MMGFALFLAQTGGHHASVKPLKGFGGGGVIEIVAEHQGDAFRTVYAVKFERAVYVLHAFQKKSKRGSRTPQSDIELVSARLRQAEEHHRQETEGASR